MSKVISGNMLCEHMQVPLDDRPLFALTGRDSSNKRSDIPIGKNMMSKHMLLLGGIGTGKTETLCNIINSIQTNLKKNDIAIIFDSKGDFYKYFYRPGDIVISNDSRATAYWNIFNEIIPNNSDESISVNASEMANTLFAEKIRHSSSPFFPNAAKDLFEAVLTHLARRKVKERLNFTNKELRDAFDGFDIQAMRNMLDAHSDLRAMKVYLEQNRQGSETQGIISELQQLVREVFIGNFSKNGDLSMRQLVRGRGGRVIFIEYDLGIGNVLSPIYTVLIDLAIKEALCNKTIETADSGSVYFFIDEFRLLPNLKHIDDGVNFGRSLGAKFFFGVQNVEQIYDAYGEHLARSILSGFTTTIAFRVTDQATREYIKGLYGKNMKIDTFRQSIATRGVSDLLHESFVIEDSDITNLSPGDAIVCTERNQPFFIHFDRFNRR